MGLSGSSKTSTTNQTQTANTTTNQQQSAQQLAAQLQSQFGGQAQSFNNTNGPSAFAQPYISSALDAATKAYNDNSSSGTASAINGLIPSLVAKYTAGADYSAPRSYYEGILSGNGSNPQLEQLIAQSNADTANNVNAYVGSRGLAGGSVQQQLLARELAKNETGLRYNDYTTQQGRKDTAASSLASLIGQESGVNSNNLASLLSAAQAGSSLANDPAQRYASTIAQLLANATSQTGTSTGSTYGQSSGINAGNTTGQMSGTSNTTGTVNGTTTEKSSGGGFLDSLLGLGGMALGGWASGGFR